MIGAVDLTDLDMWVRGVPYEEFARLRREAPVAWFPDDGWFALGVLALGFLSTFVTRARRSASSQLADLSRSGA
jgi:hypothetical protein